MTGGNSSAADADLTRARKLWRDLLAVLRTCARAQWLSTALVALGGIAWAVSSYASAKPASSRWTGWDGPLLLVGIAFGVAGGAFAAWGSILQAVAQRADQAKDQEIERLQRAATDARLQVTQAALDAERADRGHSAAIEELSAQVEGLQEQVGDWRLLAKQAAKRVLEGLANDYEFGATERINVYLVRPEEETLRLAARHSSHLGHAKASSDRLREELTFRYGLIGQVAQTGERVTDGSGPSPADAVEYRRWQQSLSLRLRKLDDLTMHSRTYDVMDIMMNGERRAVICLESENGDEQKVIALGDSIATGAARERMLSVVELLTNAPGGRVWGEE